MLILVIPVKAIFHESRSPTAFRNGHSARKGASEQLPSKNEAIAINHHIYRSGGIHQAVAMIESSVELLPWSNIGAVGLVSKCAEIERNVFACEMDSSMLIIIIVTGILTGILVPTFFISLYICGFYSYVSQIMTGRYKCDFETEALNGKTPPAGSISETDVNFSAHVVEISETTNRKSDSSECVDKSQEKQRLEICITEALVFHAVEISLHSNHFPSLTWRGWFAQGRGGKGETDQNERTGEETNSNVLESGNQPVQESSTNSGRNTSPGIRPSGQKGSKDLDKSVVALSLQDAVLKRSSQPKQPARDQHVTVKIERIDEDDEKEQSPMSSVTGRILSTDESSSSSEESERNVRSRRQKSRINRTETEEYKPLSTEASESRKLVCYWPNDLIDPVGGLFLCEEYGTCLV
ncbi:unnamed protein product [Anisakis simplex]|uniref:Ion_trans domain-containing protein n=1 Tax=Anisakis simplex TaxID=6269 RepID=A0A0M3K4E8_ANISI|nr:unnamed protein product [Anisakis simplex]